MSRGRPKKDGKRMTVRMDLDNYQRINELAHASDDDFSRVMNLLLKTLLTAPVNQELLSKM